MGLMSCVDAVSYVVDDATNALNGSVKIIKRERAALLKLCSLLDNASDEFEVKAFLANVNPNTMEIDIIIRCEIFVIDDKKHNFYEVASATKSFEFSSHNGLADIKLTFPSIWEEF